MDFERRENKHFPTASKFSEDCSCLSDSRDLGLHPVLNLALTSITLKCAQCAADRADFIRLVQIGDGLIQLSIGKGLHAAAHGQ